jgi:hypothetical protein
MSKLVAAILYLVTALSTSYAGQATFRIYTAFSPMYARWADWLAVFYFAAPAIFFLAGTSALWKDKELGRSKWITVGVVLLGLTLFFLRQGFGWRLLAEAGGALISAIFLLSSLVKQSSRIALIGTVIYAASQGRDLVPRLQMYWALGGSLQHLLATISAPILVLASLVMAVMLHAKSRARKTRVHLDAPDLMAKAGSLSTSSTTRAVSVLGAILISIAGFSLLLWAVAHVTPWFLDFSQSRWARILPAVSCLFIVVGGWMRHRSPRAVPERPKPA